MSDIQAKTHLKINASLCGKIVELHEQGSNIELTLTQDMAVDDKGLIHGGFIFGLADYAAMVAVNDLNVVLGSANVKFTKPAKVGDVLRAEAQISKVEHNKYTVEVQVWGKGTEEIFYGEFVCIVPKEHVLNSTST
jgi:uncharacterized protein (TIGR00369 family)